MSRTRQGGRPERLLRFLSRISIRLLAFNVLVVFLPIAGLWSLESYERELLRLLEESNVQQGRLLAAALGERGSLEAEEARRILVNLNQRTTARLRLIDDEFNLLADSSRLGPRAEEVVGEPEAEPAPRDSWIYRLGSALYKAYEGVLPPEAPLREAEFYATAEKIDGEEIRRALEGGYGSAVRVSTSGRSLILYSALPILSDGEVVGVALVSRSTFTVLDTLYDLRLQTFQVVLISVAVAVILSLLVSTTIARPLRRLRRDALAVFDRRGRLKEPIQPYMRLDEIGDLSRALHELTRRLERHIRFIEGFASDVSHEFKNPLASIRNAAELLADVEEPAERERFHRMVVRDIRRLEKLLTGVREITQIDAQLDDESSERVRLDELLAGLVEQFVLRRERDLRFVLEVPEEPMPDELLTVEAPPDRLAQVFGNLLDNAQSFSPVGGEVRCRIEAEGEVARVSVTDSGPGIPDEHLEKIFARFFSYRPDGAETANGHTGLGLAIVKAIVEGSGGTIRARNAPEGGAIFEVELPRAT